MQWIHNEGFVDGVALSEIAEKVGTPCYVYSEKEISDRCQELLDAFSGYPTLPCFAVKANSNLSILKLIFSKGLGADIVSQGELERVLAAGVDPQKIVFSGVGKSGAELKRAVEIGIKVINIESVGELALLQDAGKAWNKTVSIAIRINPNIDVKTNPYIATGLYSTKFGIAETEMDAVLELIRKSPNLKLTGLSCHLGSQIMETGPFSEASQRMVQLCEQLRGRGFDLDHIDLGGGLGIQYEDDKPPSFKEYAGVLTQRLKGTNLQLLIEPGRSIVGKAGTLLTRVMNIKQSPQKTFVIVDAAMTELIRPSLYEAYHPILSVSQSTGSKITADVVGPVCETGDILGTERTFSGVKPGSLLGIECAGAYGSSMSSHYNTRPKAPEVLVSGSQFKVIRKRESFQDLWKLES